MVEQVVVLDAEQRGAQGAVEVLPSSMVLKRWGVTEDESSPALCALYVGLDASPHHGRNG